MSPSARYLVAAKKVVGLLKEQVLCIQAHGPSRHASGDGILCSVWALSLKYGEVNNSHVVAVVCVVNSEGLSSG